jgi:osmotically-inducible protein OsmY
MSTSSVTTTDIAMRDAVMRQLAWDPEVDASAIGVVARNGAVTLTGYVDTYAGKLAAERAAKRVYRVRAVANDVEVRSRLGRTDTDIAQDAARALALRSTVPAGIQVTVHDGRVTLTGNAAWLFERESAERAVHLVPGVRAVANRITVTPRAGVRDVRHRIVKALHHNADVDASHIVVDVSGSTATLTGTVASWQQRESAERAAAATPGIAHVENRVEVHSVGDLTDDTDDGLAVS